MVKKIIILAVGLMLVFGVVIAQNTDSTYVYKKRVLENAEVDFLMSLYGQKGGHSAVSGGIGNEELTDITPTIVISIPLSDDDVLTIDAGISAYSSASSSNVNPFESRGMAQSNASSGGGRGGDDDDDDDDDDDGYLGGTPIGTPWLASSGASKKDELKYVLIDFSHSSDSRNFLWGANVAYSHEYDYQSIGFGGNITGLFNQKNTEIGLKGQVYLDQWDIIYPTELHEYEKYGNTFYNKGYFKGVALLNQNGQSTAGYLPSDFTSLEDPGRNSYSFSFFVSQILSKRLQVAIFLDVIHQKGLLSTPYHRIYFADKPNYYIGEASDISVYTTPQNNGVFHLADDIERLPSTRLKIPIGARLNYYINEIFVVRTYYRYYSDDWGLQGNTASIELPVKLNQAFTITPGYRFYQQNSVDYFAPYEAHLSSQEYYTSDYDLAEFNSSQYSMALNYTDIFTGFKISRLGFKNANIKFSHYDRSDGLKANIVSVGFKFVFE